MSRGKKGGEKSQELSAPEVHHLEHKERLPGSVGTGAEERHQVGVPDRLPAHVNQAQVKRGESSTTSDCKPKDQHGHLAECIARRVSSVAWCREKCVRIDHKREGKFAVHAARLALELGDGFGFELGYAGVEPLDRHLHRTRTRNENGSR